ncbi:MAG: MASE1 domain-containing protein [Candidimonas sp.]
MGSTRTLRIILFALVYGMLAFYSLGLREAGGQSSLLWPASGILLGTLMVSRRADWPWWLAIAGVLHLLAGLYNERPPSASLIYVLADVVTLPIMASIWLSRIPAKVRVLDVPENLTWFLIVLALGGVSGSLLVALGLLATGMTSFSPAWQAWVVSSVIGNLVGAPLVVAWSTFRARRSGGTNQRNFLIGLVWFLLLIATAMVAFDSPTSIALLGKSSYELTYLPVLFVVLVALVWGQKGLTLSLLLLALIAALNTLQGEGPFAQMDVFFDTTLLEVQGYIGAAALAGLVMAATSSNRNRALRDAAAWKARFEASLASNGLLLYEYDPSTQTMLWAGELQNLFGAQPPRPDTLEALLEQVHPDDRPRVEACFADRAAGLPGDDDAEPLRYRIRKTDGTWQSVIDIGAPISVLEGEIHAVSGLLRAHDGGSSADGPEI